jgi:hypothetical protein
VADAAAAEVAGAAAVEVAGAAAADVAEDAAVAPFLPPFLVALVAVATVATLEAAVDAVPATLELATGTVCPLRIFYKFIVSGRTMDGRIRIKGVRTNLQDACVNGSRDNYAIAIHLLVDWTRC